MVGRFSAERGRSYGFLMSMTKNGQIALPHGKRRAGVWDSATLSRIVKSSIVKYLCYKCESTRVRGWAIGSQLGHSTSSAGKPRTWGRTLG